MAKHHVINGRLGGLLILQRYGSQHYAQLGKRGGRPTVEESNAENGRIWDSKSWRTMLRHFNSLEED